MVVLILASAILGILVTVDFFITVLHPNGAGPLTALWSRGIWQSGLWLHRRRPSHTALSFAGPLILMVTIVSWYVLTAIAFLLLFLASAEPVVSSGALAEPTGILDQLYFVTATISGLGYGDLVPHRFPWTLLATGGTFFTTVLLTVSLSYILNVVAAAIERRNIACAIVDLGETLPEMVNNIAADRSVLESYLLTVAGDINQQALKQEAYPIVSFFHPSTVRLSLSPALLQLSDAVFLLEHFPAECRLSGSARRLVKCSIERHLAFMPRVTNQPQDDSRARPLWEAAEKLRIPRDNDPAFAQAVAEYLPKRTRLLAACREEGWTL